MTLSFYVSKEQKEVFTKMYIEDIKLKMEKGDHVFSQSNFFLEILNYYVMNKKEEI